MCNSACIEFGVRNLAIEEVKGKKIIEVGSYDVNGSLRPIIEAWGTPDEYVGVDIIDGPGVDLICPAEEIIEKFGKESFDIVISTEMLEHVRDWRKVISNIKNICKPNGLILITTRSYGFGYHDFPYDFWRFESVDMTSIFSDCNILNLQNDKSDPGVFIKVQKPAKFVEKNLTSIKLYSVIVDKRVNEITERDLQTFRVYHSLRKIPGEKLKKMMFKIIQFFV
jgi:SAM-dependent methyltransferase